ncbi:enoyl-ACP reductase [Spiribacter aquaticus]|jgi:enoyl-[acyl-carrier protein] reductase I|uniref:Enoyl-[acyl-carrier-protein] reductase [NADH] n=2 Tax=Spiribacter TaxID=1335745 RepID=A0A557RJZ8_9GAMM|nr:MULTISPECIES: enoyl-ACP reductase [Spiribacter]KAF0279983.1 enoyl-[acyl-carrier-protein] reductase [Spiribacter roseus]PYZ99866.1 enoyl-[acyl-carrier-protein] reductase FabI [Gammaproteobacteria bacterium 2W06]TVO65491.1 enoyl-ACP reductase [Spiribacter aquaticus]
MGFLDNRKALITGVASNRSIAWGIAEAMHREGAEVALTYQNEKLKRRVEQCSEACGGGPVLPLDVADDAQIDAVFKSLADTWGHLDIVVHAVGFAPRDELEGSFVENTTRAGFGMAHDISAYSFIALARGARPLMQGRNGSLLTLTYLGGERALPNYNVMGAAKASLESSVRYMASDLGAEGIRVNAVSAGPIRTLAASGIGDFRRMLDFNAAAAPMRRNVSIEEVGNTSAFLCSDLASGITGEIVHVDGGFHSVALAGTAMDGEG